tara:strand:- start:1124 stop:2167 length:1044 start_codon:yes stop_codon:yes gene_type:complete
MQNALQIEIDRLKYHTIEDLLSDYDFISKPTSENILFLDLNEAGHYYPYSTTKYWKFNSLYHIYRFLHPENRKNTSFYNNDIHIDYNHHQIKTLMGISEGISVKSFPWYAVCRGYMRGDYSFKDVNKKILYNVIFMCGEQRLNRLMILNELHEYDNFAYSNRSPRIEDPETITYLNFLDDNNVVVNGIKTNSDVLAPNFVFRKNSWCTSIKKTLTDRTDLNILGDVPEEYSYSGIELVGESYTDKGCCLSEKILKPLYYKKPFIAMASKGYHTFLENQGFYLYDELFDYSFDRGSFKIRFNSLMTQMKRLLEMPSEELKIKIDSIQYKLDFNHELIIQKIESNNDKN